MNMSIYKNRELFSELKQKAGVSNMDVAERLQVHLRTVDNLSADLNRLSAGQIVELADLFGITSTQLFDKIEQLNK
jgi:plasmid maintenance system antidote protein VapI